MAKVRVHNLTVTLDGFAAGVDQRLEAPFGDGVEGLHDWMFAAMEDGATGVDAERVRLWDVNTGATIMGRNMFGPVRGDWPDESWKGWWGDNPPYHHDVFVRTHHLRPSFAMEGGTTFHFSAEPADVVLERALTAAGGQDVIIAGGAATIQQYLQADLIDELSLVIVPLLAGRGERLFDNLGDISENYRVDELVSSEKATHARLVRR
ncbi:RibD domain-containing protein [Kribbella orskensis]|uniref:RibD domain-containing protein n=1 Tax=Kribbella orskensis TaxID=2512216 RepID=A0ABY2B7M1_9ACTN|nr:MULTISPECIES: dihydrofolate reductase family protein [Kribbella]TCN29663.1 RibD domain-containing protein [Kribbella sp. VKM Ac-2500]TCO10062.1 RibD domain-containing protein [Kribbella orskensis]